MDMFHGWQDGKYVLFVVNNRKSVARISLKPDEVEEVIKGMQATGIQVTYIYEGHEQIV